MLTLSSPSRNVPKRCACMNNCVLVCVINGCGMLDTTKKTASNWSNWQNNKFHIFPIHTRAGAHTHTHKLSYIDHEYNENEKKKLEAPLSLPLCTDEPWVNTTRIINSSSNRNSTHKQRNKDNMNRKNTSKNYNYNGQHYDDYYDYPSSGHRSYNQSNKHTKYPASYPSNRTYVWPSHTNQDINNYFGNRTQPRYYLGN